MKLNPRVTISSGHGLSSRHPGEFDPGAPKAEALRVRELAALVAADLRALEYRGMKADHRDRGRYDLADDDAAAFDADLFVELHLNAGGGHGTETFTARNHTRSEDRAAHIIQRRVCAALGTADRGVKRADFAVLTPRKDMASVLAELYFADSAIDRARADKREKALELAVLNAVLEYCGWKTVRSRPRTWKKLRRAAYRP